MNLMCRELPQNLMIVSFIKSGGGPEIFQTKSHPEMSNNSTQIFKSAWSVRKTTKEEDKLKMKLLSLMPSSWGISFGSLPKSHASSNCIWCDF